MFSSFFIKWTNSVNPESFKIAEEISFSHPVSFVMSPRIIPWNNPVVSPKRRCSYEVPTKLGRLLVVWIRSRLFVQSTLLHQWSTSPGDREIPVSSLYIGCMLYLTLQQHRTLQWRSGYIGCRWRRWTAIIIVCICRLG